MIAFAIKAMLLGKSTLGKAWAWLTASSVHLLLAALATALAWGAIERHGKATLARALHSTKAAYAMAQADAMRAQQAADAALSARYDTIARDNSHEHQIALTEADSAVARYADAHRVRACPDSSARQAEAAGLREGSEIHPGPSPAPDMAVISDADLAQLTDGTVRAESCRALGQAWVDAGIAVVGD